MIVCNWWGTGPGTLPALDPCGICVLFGSWREKLKSCYYLKEKYETDDIADIIGGEIEDIGDGYYQSNVVDIIYDGNGDMLKILPIDGRIPEPVKGTVYIFDEVVVIAPDGWN